MSCCYGSKISGSQQIMILQIWQKKKKKRKKLTCMTFLCMIELRNKVVAHTMYFSSSFGNANNHLCQEKLLRSMSFASMVMGHHTSPLYFYDRSTAN